jgi:hypothetical protein
MGFVDVLQAFAQPFSVFYYRLNILMTGLFSGRMIFFYSILKVMHELLLLFR